MELVGTWDLFPINFKEGKTLINKLIEAIEKKRKLVMKKLQSGNGKQRTMQTQLGKNLASFKRL